MVAPFFATLATLLFGCDKPPVYDNISAVAVRTQTAQGTAKAELKGEKLEEAIACLYNTVEVKLDESDDDLLQSIVLMEVRDRYGDRVFEFFTDKNFKGNKGKYYSNDCIYRLISKR